MPLYEYKCQECGEIQEVLQPNSTAEQPPCSNCGSEKTNRLISAAVSHSSAGSSSVGASCTTGICPLA